VVLFPARWLERDLGLSRQRLVNPLVTVVNHGEASETGDLTRAEKVFVFIEFEIDIHELNFMSMVETDVRGEEVMIMMMGFGCRAERVFLIGFE
jgi:hypothetical protein